MRDRVPTDRPATTGPVLAVDIGGTKFAVGAVDADGRILDQRRVPRPDLDEEGLIGVVFDLLDDLERPDGLLGCGIGCGGPMTAGGELVSPLNIPAWRDVPLRARVAAHVEVPTWCDNDAKALALAEGWVGAAAGVDDYLAMVVSTGVGGGIVLDGRLLDGAAGNAGHIGHVVVADDGRALPDHVTGVLEAEASGTALAHHHGRPAAELDLEVRVETGRLVGRAVGSVANLLDLRLAVVAGSVALGFGEDFFAAAQAEVDRICQLDFSRGTRIVPAGLGADGPLIGAAAVAFRQLPGWSGPR